MKKTGKIVTWIVTAGMLLSLVSCGQNSADHPGLQSLGADILNGDDSMQATGAGGAVASTGTQGTDAGMTKDGGTARHTDASGGGLYLLASQKQQSVCYTQDGYYYLPGQPESLSDGSYGSRLMYMDFATLQEVYLCSNAGCNHNSADCQALCLYDEFPPFTALLFVYQDALWILSREGEDNSMYVDSTESVSLGSKMKEMESVLYRMNLDGTDRRKVHTFEQNVAVEDLVLGDEEGIYVVEKEVAAKQEGTHTYYTSMSRRLVRVNPDTGQETQVCSLDFGDGIQWNILGGYGNELLLSGTDYGRAYTQEEYYDDDTYKTLLENSVEIYASLDLDSGQKTERYRISNREENCDRLVGHTLYVSSREGGGIKAIDLDTGAERTVCVAEGNYYYIWDVVGDKLCCKDQSWDSTFYYIDMNTGTVSHSPLVNLSLGWSLEFKAVLDQDVLVVYDYDAVASGFGGYEIKRFQYGLISKEDLVAGNGNYRKIQMVGRGE